MRNLTNLLQWQVLPFRITYLFLFLLFFYYSPSFSQSGECIIVIQGKSKPVDQDFIRKSTNILVKGFGAFPGGADIKVFRPKTEPNNMGADPQRTDQTFDDKEDLLKKIKSALCDESCKNVVIAFVGHGMGGENIRLPPPNKDAGGMMIGDGSTNKDFLKAEDIAKIINECPKGIKIFSSHCYAEAMYNGIKKHLNDPSVIGVGVASSEWDKVSIATNGFYDFIKYFLEDYYTIIKDPNVLEELKKEAAKLKAKNDEIRKKKAADKAALETQLAAKQKEYDDCVKKQREADSLLNIINKEIERIDSLKAALEKLKEIEEELEQIKEDYKEKGADKRQLKKDKKAKEAERKKQRKVVKKFGGSYSTSNYKTKMKRFEKDLDALDKKKEEELKEKEKKNKEWEKHRDDCIELEEALDKLKEAIKKIVVIPERDPLMEVIIHEAFKSAKAKTKTSDAKETVVPKEVAGVNLPSLPGKLIAVGENWYKFYKVIDKKTKKCVIVGWVTNKAGVPLYPIKSTSCKMDCSETKFSYTDDNGTHKIEIVKDKDKKYNIKDNGTKVAKWDYVYEGTGLKIGKKKIGTVYIRYKMDGTVEIIPKSKVSDVKFNPPVLSFTYKVGNKTYKVTIKYLPHGGKEIKIDQNKSYTIAQYKRSSLYDQNGIRQGELCYILREEFIEGLLWKESDQTYTSFDLPISDLDNSITTGNWLLTSLLQDLSTQSSWVTPSSSGYIQNNISAIPELTNSNVIATENKVVLGWDILLDGLSPFEKENFLGTRILRYEAGNKNPEIMEVSPEIRLHQDEISPLLSYEYHLMPIMKNDSYCSCSDQTKWPYYGFSEIVHVTPKKKFPVLPVVGTLVGGGIITAILLSKDSDSDDDTDNPPNAICKNTTLSLNESGQGIIDVTMIDGGSSDAEGNVDLSFNNANFDCNDIGNQTVLLTVTDQTGQTDECSAIVNIVDNRPPTAICVNMSLVLDNSGMASISSNMIDGSSFDNCGSVESSINKTVFGCEDIGMNEVVLTVTDLSGNTSTCSAIVTVSENIPPIALCQDVELGLGLDGTATLLVEDVDAGSSDNCGIDNINLSKTSFTCDDIGTQTITMIVTDNSGNSTECSANIIVSDQSGPQLECKSYTAFLNENGTVEITMDHVVSSYSDGCGGAVNISINPSSYSCQDLGDQVVVVTSEDQYGNQSTCNAAIEIVDQFPPDAICNPATGILDDSGIYILNPLDVDGGSTDNCEIANWSVAPSSFTSDHIGENAVVLIITDLAGNISSCETTFTLIDGACNLTTTTQTTPAVCGLNNGSAILTILGSGNYMIQWDNGQTGNQATELTPGVHEVIITDPELNCSDIIFVFIEAIDEFQFATVTDIIPGDCVTPAQITILVDSPGSGPVSVFVEGTEGTQEFEAFPGDVLIIEAPVEGEYMIQAWDQSIGQSCMQQTMLLVPFDYNVIEIQLFPEGQGILVQIITPYPGHLPFTIFLDGEEIAQTNMNNYFFPVEAFGTYGVYVMDSEGCRSNEQFVEVTGTLEVPTFGIDVFVNYNSLLPSNYIRIRNPEKIPISEIELSRALYSALHIQSINMISGKLTLDNNSSINISMGEYSRGGIVKEYLEKYHLNQDVKWADAVVRYSSDPMNKFYLDLGVGWYQTNLQLTKLGANAGLNEQLLYDSGSFARFGLGVEIPISKIGIFEIGSNWWIDENWNINEKLNFNLLWNKNF